MTKLDNIIQEECVKARLPFTEDRSREIRKWLASLPEILHILGGSCVEDRTFAIPRDRDVGDIFSGIIADEIRFLINLQLV
jgi:hypothetical protein